MTVTVYSKDRCVYCDATYRALLTVGIEFTVVCMQDNQKLIDYCKALGHQQAPVVVVGDMHWSGLRPDRIIDLKQLLTSQGVTLTPRSPEEVNKLLAGIKHQVKNDSLANKAAAQATRGIKNTGKAAPELVNTTA